MNIRKPLIAWAIVENQPSWVTYWHYERNDYFDKSHTIAGIFLKRKEAKDFLRSWDGGDMKKNLVIKKILITTI